MWHEIGKWRDFILAATVALLMTGCGREMPSDEPPLHLDRGMDRQPKYRAQAKSSFYEDGSSMRLPPAGTVPFGQEDVTGSHYTGKDAAGNFVTKGPAAITMQTLKRGQERFNIYCAPCHSRVGDGKGIMVSRGYLPPPTFHEERIRMMPDGQIFDVISAGVRNMPSYRQQIAVDDRWAIVAYLRALQRSQNATGADIPENMQGRIK